MICDFCGENKKTNLRYYHSPVLNKTMIVRVCIDCKKKDPNVKRKVKRGYY